MFLKSNINYLSHIKTDVSEQHASLAYRNFTMTCRSEPTRKAYYNRISYTENLMEIMVNEAAILYEKMVKEFTDETINNAATGNSSNVLSSMVYEQTDHTQALAYRHIIQTSLLFPRKR